MIPMSTQISKSLIALFFLGMFVTGCNTNTKQTADNDIKFDSIRVDRTYHLLNNPDNPNCNLQLNFTYPAKFSDKEILKKIQNDFVLSYFGENYENLSPEEAVAKYTEDYLNNYKELEADCQLVSQLDCLFSIDIGFPHRVRIRLFPLPRKRRSHIH